MGIEGQGSGVRVQWSGFRASSERSPHSRRPAVYGLWLRVQASGLRVKGLVCGVWGLGFGAYGLWFMVQGLGFTSRALALYSSMV